MTEQVERVPGAALRLASVDNFRDVSGDGYVGADGRALRSGVFFRSNELRLSDEDVATVGALGLTRIMDLRAAIEIERHPDPEILGTAWEHHDIHGVPMDELIGLQTPEAAVDLMDRIYRGFVDSPVCRTAFGGVFHALADGGPQLFHCTAGKDRTGWVSALLLHAVGVDDATIERDYLLTNERAAASRARTLAEITAHLGEGAVAIFEPTIGVDLAYLHAAYDSVERSYGDRATYLHDGLGVEDSTLDALRSHLLG